MDSFTFGSFVHPSFIVRYDEHIVPYTPQLCQSLLTCFEQYSSEVVQDKDDEEMSSYYTAEQCWETLNAVLYVLHTTSLNKRKKEMKKNLQQQNGTSSS